MARTFGSTQEIKNLTLNIKIKFELRIIRMYIFLSTFLTEEREGSPLTNKLKLAAVDL